LARTFILVLGLVFCLLSPRGSASAELSDEAQRHFESGLAYADDPSGPKWEEALREFQTAYALSPTWKLKNNIGLCSLHLERDGEAIEAYKEYLAHGGEGGLSAKHRKQIERDIAMLSASLVRVTIEAEPGEAAIIDERRTSTGEWRINRYSLKGGKATLGLHPGTRRITVEAVGYKNETWDFDAAPASTHQRSFRLETKANGAPTPRASKLNGVTNGRHEKSSGNGLTGVYLGLASTGVFAAATATMGVLALRKDTAYAGSSSVDERAKLKDSGETLVLLANTFAIATVVSAGLTAYAYFTMPEKSPSRTADRGIGLSLEPVLSFDAAGLTMWGSFH
jgi:hypothetical protein